MIRVRALVLILAGLIWAAAALAADYAAKREELAGIGRNLAAVERDIPAAAEDDAKLITLRVKLEDLSKALIGFGVSLRPRLVEINNRLTELGSPPKEGEPPEPTIIVDERRALAEEKAINNGLLGEAEALSIRAGKASDQIAALRRELFANTLFRRTDISSVFGSQVLRDLADEFHTVTRQVTARLTFMASFRRDALIGAIGLSLLLGFRLIGAFAACSGGSGRKRKKRVKTPISANCRLPSGLRSSRRSQSPQRSPSPMGSSIISAFSPARRKPCSRPSSSPARRSSSCNVLPMRCSRRAGRIAG
jgi:hypothetical protein